MYLKVWLGVKELTLNFDDCFFLYSDNLFEINGTQKRASEGLPGLHRREDNAAGIFSNIGMKVAPNGWIGKNTSDPDHQGGCRIHSEKARQSNVAANCSCRILRVAIFWLYIGLFV